MRSAVLLVLVAPLVFSDGLKNVSSSEMLSTWPAPCQKTSDLEAFGVFQSKYIVQEHFNTAQTQGWVDYLTRRRLCGVNPHQIFLRKQDGGSIIAVCNGGGVRDSQNLCVSSSSFSVFVVQSVKRNGRCEVQIQTENAHVIFACESIFIHCFPVYFAGITYFTPSYSGQRCRR